MIKRLVLLVFSEIIERRKPNISTFVSHKFVRLVVQTSITVLVLEGICFFPLNFSWSQSVDTQAAQVQKLSQQSRKFIDEYKTKKKNIEAELQQKLKTLTNSPPDRLRRRQWVQESNQKLRLLQQEFTLQMDTLEEAKSKLIHPGAEFEGPAVVRPAPRPRAISDEELKARINQQDELFRQEKGRWNPAPREPFPVEPDAVENNPHPAVSDENSSQENPPPVLFPPAPPADQEPSREKNVNMY